MWIPMYYMMNAFSYKIALTKKASKKHIGDFLQKTEEL